MSGAALVAACSQPSTPSPAKPAESKPADAKPAAPAAAAQPTSAPAAAAKPADAKPAEAKPAAPPAAPAAAAPPPDPKVTSGVFNVWFSANWNTVTDEAVGNTFVDWGKANGGIKVEWQSIPGSPQLLAKQSAAVAAGQPPELSRDNLVYWHSQGEVGKLNDLVAKFKGQAGGMYDIAISSMTASDGSVIGAPYAIDVWPPQWRIDEIGAVNNGKFFETWDQLIELGPKAQKPPRTYTIAFALGHEGDHVNNFCSVIWGYGGRLADEKGKPDIVNPANKAGIETIKRMWDAKVIPPDSFAQTVTSWNNETYQKGRGLISINPATIMGWLLVNDKELAEKTGIAQNPAGPKGSFAEGGALAFNYFKKAKLADKAESAMEYFIQPPNLEKISKSVEGRFVPVYRDHTKTDFWEKSKFVEMKKIAENGRIREWPAAPQPWIPEITDAKYTLSDMLNKVLNENMKIEDAQEWAQKEMMDSYSKLVKQ
ncbi:MAG: carbohydrate ABC transporter substrate-binding protein [Chloroflexi bacterium]|nr:carbohydrate ABC transporter substrate-binding protein [Chloroflexota bacterium]